MGIMVKIREQFEKPTGFWGRLVGQVMTHAPSNRERMFWTLGLLNLHPEDRVLEVGFGPGLAIEELSQRVQLVVGLDHSAVMLTQARQRNRKQILAGRVRLHLGSVPDLSESEHSFDQVLSINCYQFWEEPVVTLKGLLAVLKPGGRIAITLQPRSPGATHDTSRKVGEQIKDDLKSAGFGDLRIESKLMKPVTTVCVQGRKP